MVPRIKRIQEEKERRDIRALMDTIDLITYLHVVTETKVCYISLPP